MSLADMIATWIREQTERVGANGAVLGLSGGLDSATVAGLAARGLGPDRVTGVIMPIQTQQVDQTHAHLVVQTFQITPMTVNLEEPFNLLIETLPAGSPLATANVKARLRMLTLYQIANTQGHLVLGTGNRSELLTGYFTKYGDSGVDLLPIGSLYKREVRTLARQIGVPEAIIDKTPSAGLWPGQTDEAELGITYDELDRILAAIDRGDTSGFPAEQVARIERMITASAHKRRPAPIFQVSEPLSMLERA